MSAPECWLHGGPIGATVDELRADFDRWSVGNGLQVGDGIRAVGRATSTEPEHCDACCRTAPPSLVIERTPGLCTCFKDPCQETVENTLCASCAGALREWALAVAREPGR